MTQKINELALTAAWTVRGWGWKEWVRGAILALLIVATSPLTVPMAIVIVVNHAWGRLVEFAFDWTPKSKISRVSDNDKGQAK